MATHTATIPSDQTFKSKRLQWGDLQLAPFNYQVPFHLPLAESQPFIGEKVVRVMPKKRLVVFGTWKDKPVVAKLFFDKNARRHMDKDVAGVDILKKNKIPTPGLFYKGSSEDGRICVLLFDRIQDAYNLDAIWETRDSSERLWPLLRSVTLEIATQHVLGVLQHDLHMKNFLIAKKRIYTLDGAQIELFPHLLSKKTSMKNLALFLSQLGVGVDELQERLFRYYARSRGWLLKKEDLLEIFFLIKKWSERRWQRYEKKIFRDSTSFATINNNTTFGMYTRRYLQPEFIEWLRNPESAFTKEGVTVLKEGRSSTVIKVMLDGKAFVLKRYNMKNLWHYLRRCLRPTRAHKSWRLAHKMELLGVLTARPIAFIEKRFLSLRGRSYYLTEYIPGEHAGEYLGQFRFQEEKITEMTKRIAALLKNLAKLEITHGDLKITNILINEHEHPVLIDLDGANEHVSLTGMRTAWRKEIKRFLDNFKDNPAIREKFQTELMAE